MTSADVTRRELNVALRTYAETTIEGVILPQGGNVAGLPVGNYAKYAHTFFTADVIYEGDQIKDANDDTYEVLNVQTYWWLDKFSHYTCELLKTVDVTLKTLTLGTQDTVTGLYALTYSAGSTKTMNLAPKGASMIQTVLGYHNKYEMSGVTSAIVYEGDKVVDASGDTYKITQVTYYPTKRSTAFSYAVCALTKVTFADRPSTSGTWHLDPVLRTDPRYRHRTYLVYLTAANLKEDNGTTNATYITCFDGADYPISRVFLTNAVDLVFSVGKEQATTKTTYNHYIYAFEESVPITLYAINKSGLTATNLIEQAEQEIRHIVTDYPLGSVRGISSIKHTPIDLGECTLYSTTVTIKYTRANDEYVPTLPTITWGPSAAPTGTFTFPNVISKRERYVANNIYMDMPGRSGSYPQKLGTKSLEVEIICDLDSEPWSGAVTDTKISWKRLQTTGAKVDVSNWQVFQDIWHEGGESEAYQKLTLEWGWFYVCMDEPVISQDGGRTLLTVVFHEYNASATNTDYRHRLGITHAP